MSHGSSISVKYQGWHVIIIIVRRWLGRFWWWRQQRLILTVLVSFAGKTLLHRGEIAMRMAMAWSTTTTLAQLNYSWVGGGNPCGAEDFCLSALYCSKKQASSDFLFEYPPDIHVVGSKAPNLPKNEIGRASCRERVKHLQLLIFFNFRASVSWLPNSTIVELVVGTPVERRTFV